MKKNNNDASHHSDDAIILLDPFQVTVNQRQRKTRPSQIEKLANNIQAVGQIHPITVDSENSLVAGFRRLMACQLLNQKVKAIRKSDIKDPILLQEIELSENIQREDLHWGDRILALDALYNLKKERDPSLSQERFAYDIGSTQSSVSEDLTVAAMIKNQPRLLEFANKEQALRAVKQIRSAVLVDALKERVEKEQAEQSEQEAQIQTDSASETEPKQPEKPVDPRKAYIEKKVLLGDCCEILPRWKPKSFDLIVTDPPYGIELLKQKRRKHPDGFVASEEAYGKDTAEAFIQLMDVVIPIFYEIMKDESHLWLFFGIEHYEWLTSKLKETGFLVDKVPALWIKQIGQTNWPEYNLARGYETFLFARKGTMPLQKQGVLNWFRIQPLSPEEKFHPTEKPISLMFNIISLSAAPGMTLLDPFCGAGSTLVAAQRLGLNFVGIELDSLYREYTIRKLLE